MPASPRRSPSMRWRRHAPDPARRGWRITAYVAAWLALSIAAGLLLFLSSSRATTVASHDAVLRPDLSGYAVIQTGPVLPDLRTDTGGVIGVRIELGKTDATSTTELVQRYAYIGGQPEGQIDKVRDLVRDMAVGAALRGAVVGLLPVLVWLLVGRRRRQELRERIRLPEAMIGVVALVALALAVGQPWTAEDPSAEEDRDWTPLAEFLGPGVPLPEELEGVEVSGDVTTTQTQRLIESAVDTYDTSQEFYATAADDAARLVLRQPADDETVVALVSDRHDNIGMDPVARAIADVAGATAVFDAGDDTSTGSRWEAFSLDSVTAAFDGVDRWGVAGNHDNGDFVHRYLRDRGWAMLDGEVVEGPGGTRLLGVDDPRSSGLGSWREETGLSFAEVGERLADEACAGTDRLTTILVHDAELGREALDRGCVDLVLGGHLHVREGPERVVGENGQVGYRYTTGTTGGAAYAIAIGSKPRREASVSLVTYRDGRPVGIQSVTLQTNGDFQIQPFVPLHLTDTAT